MLCVFQSQIRDGLEAKVKKVLTKLFILTYVFLFFAMAQVGILSSNLKTQQNDYQSRVNVYEDMINNLNRRILSINHRLDAYRLTGVDYDFRYAR
jgi:ABC-type transporter lipoprotein component MlaA